MNLDEGNAAEVGPALEMCPVDVSDVTVIGAGAVGSAFACCKTALAHTAGQPTVLLGDLNILEPSHKPQYPFFAPFEYAFCSRELAGLVMSCQYVHQPRSDKLSDHSALTLHLDLAAPQELAVVDPTAADEPDTLF